MEDVNYPIYNDYSIFTNILFIDRNILQYQIFIDGANANTYPISYSSLCDDVTKLNEFLFSTFTNIDRVCFAFHGPSLDTIEPSISFIQNAPFFIDDDLATDVTDFSKNILFIQNLITTLHVKNIDYLGCNLLTFSNWKSYFELIEKNTSVIVGASNDETGNLNYGGDWVMENTNENIKQIYFNETIYTFIGVLSTVTPKWAAGVVGNTVYDWATTHSTSIGSTNSNSVVIFSDIHQIILTTTNVTYSGTDAPIDISFNGGGSYTQFSPSIGQNSSHTEYFGFVDGDGSSPTVFSLRATSGNAFQISTLTVNGVTVPEFNNKWMSTDSTDDGGNAVLTITGNIPSNYSDNHC